MAFRRVGSVLLLAVLCGCSSVLDAPDAPSVSTTYRRSIPTEALNPDVSQATIQRTVCVAGYTSSVRPSTSYTKGVKARLLREQGLPSASASEFELDHVIPLALGGHPRNMANLALQPWEGENSAKTKDRLERKLQALVCADKLPLDIARRDIYQDWQAAFRKYIGVP
jgi:hypothetical protein